MSDEERVSRQRSLKEIEGMIPDPKYDDIIDVTPPGELEDEGSYWDGPGHDPVNSSQPWEGVDISTVLIGGPLLDDADLPTIEEAAEKGVDPDTWAYLMDGVRFATDARRRFEIDRAQQAAMEIHHTQMERSVNRYLTALKFSQVLQDVEQEEHRGGTPHPLPSFIRAHFKLEKEFDDWNQRVAETMLAAESDVKAQEQRDVMDQFNDVYMGDKDMLPAGMMGESWAASVEAGARDEGRDDEQLLLGDILRPAAAGEAGLEDGELADWMAQAGVKAEVGEEEGAAEEAARGAGQGSDALSDKLLTDVLEELDMDLAELGDLSELDA
ncbi:unnamed protein product [Pedinophyceae sp. YPF-701]|nr:unnamed protein product [Pedinophyceae sp. YPF-701]